MPRRFKVEQLVAERYGEGEMANAILADVEKHGTRDKIESGELVLPHYDDAEGWHARVTGRSADPGQRAMEDRLRALEQLVKERDEGAQKLHAERIDALQKRIDELEGKHP